MTTAPSSPNVLVVFPDSLRGSAAGCSGDPNVETPVIDGLAADGVRFENAYSTFPICVPTRYTLLTGEYAHDRLVPGIGWRMPETEHTLANAFGDAGFQTAHFGKWHLASDETSRGYSRQAPQLELRSQVVADRGVPRSRQGGFDRWCGYYGGSSDYFHPVLFNEGDPTPNHVDGYVSDVLADRVISYIREERDDDQPFFLRYGPNPPHNPHEAPDPYMERWRDRDIELHPNVGIDPDSDSRYAANSREQVLEELRGYYAMIENLDDNVGRILNALEAEGIRDETVVVFLSDHGEMLGSHGLMAKCYPYEESAGVPFIVSQPGRIDDGRVISEPTCSEDWYPTFLGLAGVEPRDDLPGADLSPLIGGDDHSLERPGVMLEFVDETRENFDWYDEMWRGFVTERFKYTVRGGAEGGRPWQLYDLDEDPYEQDNLIEDSAYEDVARRLHGHLRDRIVETEDPYLLRSALGHDGVNEHWLEIGG